MIIDLKKEAEYLNTTRVVYYTTMVVVDSSSLILMAKSGMLDKVVENLKEKMVITGVVYDESISKKEAFDAKIIKERVGGGSIKRIETKNPRLYNKIREDFNLGKGEASAISLCLENKAGLITDDKKAINACKVLKIRFTTAVDLLPAFYRKGLITKAEAEAYFDKLIKFGRYSNKIVQKTKEVIEDEKKDE